MTILRIFWHFIELLVTNLITESNGPGYVWRTIFLESLLSYKKLKVLFLPYVLIFKNEFQRQWEYYSSKGIFKHIFKVILKPLNACFPKEPPPYFQRCMNTAVYFCTQAVGRQNDYSSDDESNPDDDDEEEDESQSNENLGGNTDPEIKDSLHDAATASSDMAKASHSTSVPHTPQKRKAKTELEKYSDPEIGDPFDDAAAASTDMAKASHSTSVPHTPQKRKAETELEKNIKRSKSIDDLNEDLDRTSLHLESETKDSAKDKKSLPVHSSSDKVNDKKCSMSEGLMARLIEGYGRRTPEKSTREDIGQCFRKEVQNVAKDPFINVPSSRSQSRPCGTPGGANRRLNEGLHVELDPSSSSDLPSTQTFPSDKTDHSPAKKKYVHKKFRTPKSCTLDDYQYESEDGSRIESQGSIPFPSTKDKNEGPFQDTDNKMQKELVSNRGQTKSSISESQRNSATSTLVRDPSTSTDERVKVSDGDIDMEKTFHYEVCADRPTTVSDNANLPPEGFNIIPAAAVGLYIENSDRKKIEVANFQATRENKENYEKSSTCANQKEIRNSGIESAEGSSQSPDDDSTKPPWDRQGCSTDPECTWRRKIEPEIENKKPEIENKKPEIENKKPESENKKPESENKEPESENKEPEIPQYEILPVPLNRSYPGLSSQPLRAKKDALYQKKFYKQKKEMVLPMKANKIIRWTKAEGRGSVPNALRQSDSDNGSMNTHPELLQDAVQGMRVPYDDVKEEQSNILEDMKKRQAEQKGPEDSDNSDSPCQGESPPYSEEEFFLRIKYLNPPFLSTPPSEDDLTEVSVSPNKPVGSASQVNLQPQSLGLGGSAPPRVAETLQMRIEQAIRDHYDNAPEDPRKMPSDAQFKILESKTRNTRGAVSRSISSKRSVREQQGAILESFKQPSSQTLKKGMSRDGPSGVEESFHVFSSDEEDFSSISLGVGEDEMEGMQRAILESLSVSGRSPKKDRDETRDKQCENLETPKDNLSLEETSRMRKESVEFQKETGTESCNSMQRSNENQGNRFLSMASETPRLNISQEQNISAVLPVPWKITPLEFGMGRGTISADVAFSGTFRPATRFRFRPAMHFQPTDHSSRPSSSSTQSARIVAVRGTFNPEREHMECGPSLSEEAPVPGTNLPSNPGPSSVLDQKDLTLAADLGESDTDTGDEDCASPEQSREDKS